MTITEQGISDFWSKVRIDDADSCWEWTGSTRRGYGSMQMARKQVYSHRMSWVLHHGQIPDGLCVCHHCDNPRCVRPGHLFLGSNADNVRDCVSKNRQARQTGESHGFHKLTAEQVLEIRAKYIPRVITMQSLADEYGVSSDNIYIIVHRKAWKHI